MEPNRYEDPWMVTRLIQIRSSALVVEILPEIGGKTGQIRSTISGREYLVPPQKPYCTLSPEGNWLQHDTSGMDDCFPNVAAGMYPDAPWSSVRLPDLGEWTHGVWEVLKADICEVTMERKGAALPYRAVKTVRFLEEETLEFSYQVSNQGRFPMRFLWSAHPLIAVQGEYEVMLPAGRSRFRTFPSDRVTHTWPMWKSIDLSREWIPYGTTLKIFVSDLSEGWCALRQPTHTLHFTFDRNELPALGIWFNNFGFPAESGKHLRCIALEPCTSANDLLDELNPAAYPSIPAEGSVHWSMRLRILQHDNGSTDAQEHKR